MPYAIIKSGDKFLVKNTDTGDIKGTHDSKAKAQAQMNILHAVEHNPNWKPNKK